MRLGLITRADKTGLGYQTQSYYKHLSPDKVMLVDISSLNGMPSDTSWYPEAQIVRGMPKTQDMTEFVKDLDVILTAETPYNYDFYTIARENGVKFANVINPEFYDHYTHPDYPMPDMIILPSVWMIDRIKGHAEARGTKVVQLHHPVDLSVFKPRVRTTKKFMHIAGRPATNDRNGTWDFLNAVPNGVVVTQNENMAHQIRSRYRHSNVFTGVKDAAFMYQLGDIMVLPRKYGGNCLPLNEALASGMPVVMTNVSPNNQFLPVEWLVGARKEGYFVPREKIDLWKADAQELADKIDWFKNCDIEAESKKAIELAHTISWETMKHKYMAVLEELCQ